MSTHAPQESSAWASPSLAKDLLSDGALYAQVLAGFQELKGSVLGGSISISGELPRYSALDHDLRGGVLAGDHLRHEAGELAAKYYEDHQPSGSLHAGSSASYVRVSELRDFVDAYHIIPSSSFEGVNSPFDYEAFDWRSSPIPLERFGHPFYTDAVPNVFAYGDLEFVSANSLAEHRFHRDVFYFDGELRSLRAQAESVEVYKLSAPINEGIPACSVIKVRYALLDASTLHLSGQLVRLLREQNRLSFQSRPRLPITVHSGPELGVEAERIRRLPQSHYAHLAWRTCAISNVEVLYERTCSYQWQILGSCVQTTARGTPQYQSIVDQQGWEEAECHSIPVFSAADRGPPSS